MKVLFVAGFGPMARETEVESSPSQYGDVMGLALEREGTYLHTGNLAGVRHFAVWPLEQAAESCFGEKAWPARVPVPHAWIEFDVENLTAATAELEAAGYQALVRDRTEPWGQRVTRFLSPEGLLVGLTVTPWMREGASS